VRARLSLAEQDDGVEDALVHEGAARRVVEAHVGGAHAAATLELSEIELGSFSSQALDDARERGLEASSPRGFVIVRRL
jgi:hypothetical protein